MTSTYFVISFKVNEGSISEFNAIMRTVETDLPNTEGCVRVTVLRQVESVTDFTLIEEWENTKVHADHVANLTASGAWDQLRGLLACDPEGSYFDPFRS